MPEKKKATGKRTLKTRGNSRKKQGHAEGKAWKADDAKKQAPRLMDKGPGSAFATATLREEAMRVKAEKKQPGALGYKVPVDIGDVTGKKKGNF